MPNWCRNKLELDGSPEAITKWEKENLNDKGVVDFDKSVPHPRTPEYDDRGWRDWNSENWGTKWNADGYSDEYVWFQTAWGPPQEWLVRMSAHYPELNFTISYDEPNEDFCGQIMVSDGIVKCWQDDCYDVMERAVLADDPGFDIEEEDVSLSAAFFDLGENVVDARRSISEPDWSSQTRDEFLARRALSQKAMRAMLDGMAERNRCLAKRKEGGAQ